MINSYAVFPMRLLLPQGQFHTLLASASISLISVAARPLMTHLRENHEGPVTGWADMLGSVRGDPPKTIGQKTMKQRLHEKWIFIHHSCNLQIRRFLEMYPYSVESVELQMARHQAAIPTSDAHRKKYQAQM